MPRFWLKIAAKKEYPNVKIKKLSPPFKAEFDFTDFKIFSDSINAFQPDVVFVGLTAPKQEKLIFKLLVTAMATSPSVPKIATYIAVSPAVISTGPEIVPPGRTHLD